MVACGDIRLIHTLGGCQATTLASAVCDTPVLLVTTRTTRYTVTTIAPPRFITTIRRLGVEHLAQHVDRSDQAMWAPAALSADPQPDQQARSAPAAHVPSVAVVVSAPVLQVGVVLALDLRADLLLAGVVLPEAAPHSVEVGLQVDLPLEAADPAEARLAGVDALLVGVADAKLQI